MAILTAERCPPAVCHQGRPLRKFSGLARRIAHKSGRWWVVQVKSNQERMIARYLYEHEHTYYLPMQPKIIRSGGQEHKGIEVVLPGFVFIYGPHEVRYAAESSRKTWGFIDVKDRIELERDLQRLDSGIVAHYPIEFKAFVRGTRVRVVSGPWKDAIATVTERFEHTMKVGLDIWTLGAAVFTIPYDKLEICTLSEHEAKESRSRTNA